MIKHQTIHDLLAQLERKLAPADFEVVDHWDADLCAIGIQRGNKLVYIANANYIGQQPMKYDFDLELLPPGDNSAYNVVYEGRGVLEAELIDAITEFWSAK